MKSLHKPSKLHTSRSWGAKPDIFIWGRLLPQQNKATQRFTRCQTR